MREGFGGKGQDVGEENTPTPIPVSNFAPSDFVNKR